MKLDPKLKEMGVDEGLINLLHSKTKLSNREIEDANLIKTIDNKYLVQLRLKSVGYKSSRLMVLNIDKERIREMKLKMIFN